MGKWKGEEEGTGAWFSQESRSGRACAVSQGAHALQFSWEPLTPRCGELGQTLEVSFSRSLSENAKNQILNLRLPPPQALSFSPLGDAHVGWRDWGETLLGT